jgi:signal transduction histidine kinase/DNA-binding response OmpR family regulator
MKAVTMNAQPLSPSLPRVRILIVDDHPSTATTLARAISQSAPETEIISSASGKMALEQVKDGAVDLLITDMMMPDMNGLELIEKLQAHPGGRPAYTILITAYDVPGLKETARRLRVNETIIKPFRPERICQIVGNMLEEMKHAEPLTRTVAAQQPFKILIADDVPDNVSLLSRYLQQEGYAFITASNGVETLQKVRSEMPDLILLDVNMPGKDGFEVLQEVRADPITEHIPVIILTAARPEPIDIQYGLNLGADDYVVKPFDRRELLARVRTRLRAKQTEESVRRRYKELSILPEIGRDFGACKDLSELAEIIVRRTVETLGAMVGQVIILSPKGPLWKTYGITASPVSELPLPRFDALIRQIKTTRQGLIIDDVRNDSRWKTAPDDPSRSAILVPLLGRLDLIGLLVLTHEQTDYFKLEHLLLLEAIASQAAIVAENARLYANIAQEGHLTETILQGMADAVLMFNGDGDITFFNSAAEKLFGKDVIRIGSPLTSVCGYQELLALLETANASRRPATGQVRCPDGRGFTANCMPLDEGGCVALLQEASTYHAPDGAKNDFSSAALHDMKSPITSILLMGELITKVGRLNKQQLEYVSRICSAAENMNRQVQNLLELANVDAVAELRQEIVDVNVLAAEVMDEFQPKAEAKAQKLLLERAKDQPRVQGNPLQLQQAVRNLLDNAVKYTPRGGSIILSLGTLDRHAVVKVQDTGYGIPTDELPLIFGRFHRVRNEDVKNIEGNGLGLAIVKSIVEKHGGMIGVESEPGKGSCFTITLPLVQQQVGTQ